MRRHPMRSLLVMLLCWSCAVPQVFAQTAAAPRTAESEVIAPIRPTTPILRMYQGVRVPPVQLHNYGRFAGLIRAGKLYLTAQDAIALALENNIDIEVARYTPITDEWNLERAEAGGALPGVPSASSQASSVTRGEGVRGTQAAAGVSGAGGTTSSANTVNATVTQIGPVTPTLDPVFQDSTTFSHISSPQANIQESLVTNLVDKQRNYSNSIQDGFLLGTTASLSYTEGYLNENAPTDILNPQYAPTLNVTVTQPLLQGFGIGVNRRTIDIDKLNLKLDDLNFKTEVISTVVNVLNLYYGLSADYDDLRAKRSAVDVARLFYENNRKQVELGTLAPLDVTTAEAQVASAEQDLATSQANLEQQQVSLKSVLSRNGDADPVLANVDVIPLDRIEVPASANAPALRNLIAQALANRADVLAEEMHLNVDKLSNQGTANTLLPFLAVQASATNQGLSGSPQVVIEGPAQATATSKQQYPPGLIPCPPPNQGFICEVPDPYLVGSYGKAAGQVFRRNYPSETITAYMAARLRNRQAQADYAIDQLSLRQDTLANQKYRNEVAVDVSNQVVALEQARVRYLAAVKSRELDEQLFSAEQKKFALGASTPYNVVTQQRDLSSAQANETAALVAYSNARVALQQTLGTTLEENHVSINEAKSGIVARQSTLPANLPNTPVK